MLFLYTGYPLFILFAQWGFRTPLSFLCCGEHCRVSSNVCVHSNWLLPWYSLPSGTIIAPPVLLLLIYARLCLHHYLPWSCLSSWIKSVYQYQAAWDSSSLLPVAEMLSLMVANVHATPPFRSQVLEPCAHHSLHLDHLKWCSMLIPFRACA